MKIVVIGAGGVGGYFGGRLAQAGYSVTFLTRGENLRVIGEHGLKIRSYLGNVHVYPQVSDDYKVIKDAELVILAVKSWQIQDIAQKMKAFLALSATVLPLQNGADNAERLLKVLPAPQVLPGLCKIVSKLESPGVIDHVTYEPEIVFGEIDHNGSERLKQIHALFESAGIKNRVSDHIERDIWLKFLFIVTISALGALTRSVLGIMRKDDYLRGIMSKTSQEILSIGIAKGVDLRQEDIDNCFKIIDQLDHHTTMSLQRDMMEGKPSELENFNGFIVHQGDLLQIDTPVNDFIYYTLRPMEQMARNANPQR